MSVSPATITFTCAVCYADDAVTALASQTDGHAYGAVADDGHTHVADVAHAWRHVGWCTVCGGVDGWHTDGCPCDVTPGDDED